MCHQAQLDPRLVANYPTLCGSCFLTGSSPGHLSIGTADVMPDNSLLWASSAREDVKSSPSLDPPEVSDFLSPSCNEQTM